MDIESQLESLSQFVPEGQLRSFGCECCQRSLPLCEDPILRELISFGQTRSARQVDIREINALRSRAVPIYDSLYPGYGSPSAPVLAMAACGEVAFTDSALKAAINAAGFAAAAIATNAAVQVPDGNYDAVFQATCASECAQQEKLLMKYVPKARQIGQRPD
jgi:hypothetical protein